MAFGIEDAVVLTIFSSPLGHLGLTTLLVALVTVLTILNVRSLIQKPLNLPPGPWGVPILGILPFMGKKPYMTLQKWWRKYGDVYSCYMGSRLVVFLNGVDAMKECHVRQGDTFHGRPWNFFKKTVKNTGLVFTDGEVWREHRRFTLRCLRDFGMGKVSLENKINEETNFVLHTLDSSNGKPINVREIMTKAVSNIILNVVYGNRFDYDDDVFQANLDALEQSARRHTMIGMVNFLPFLECVLKLLPTDTLLQRNIEMRDHFAADKLKEHIETLDHENPRDLIDAYLIRMKHFKDADTPTTFEDRQLKRTILDLFITGTETMSTTMGWAFYFMAWHPDIQTKVQAEIDDVVGRARMARMNDRPSMPYTEATIMECQRLGNISMLSLPRCTMERTKVNGYDIPKGTWIMTNRWGVHASSTYWKKPSVFNPDRFLKDGKVFKPEGFIPFGMGPRSCIGEIFAKMELFLFFTNVLQTFTLRQPEGAPEPSLEPVLGINMTPQPYRIIASQR